MRKTKQKQKQKQTQSTNINIKIGDTRKRRGKKRRAPQKEEVKQSMAPPRVVTQFVGQGVPLQSQMQGISNLNEYIKKSDLESFRDKLMSGFKQGMQPELLSAQGFSTSGSYEPKWASSSSSSEAYDPILPDLRLGSGPIEQPDLSSLLPPVGSSSSVQDEASESEPGQIMKTDQPSLLTDLTVSGKPIYDTGFDFQINKRSGPVTERIYLSSRGAPYVLQIEGDDGYYMRPFSDKFGGKNAIAVKDELASRNIVYDRDAPESESFK